jgi:hypothetical protein
MHPHDPHATPTDMTVSPVSPDVVAAWAMRAVALVSRLEAQGVALASSAPLGDRNTATLVASLHELTEIAAHAAERLVEPRGSVNARWLSLLDHAVQTAGSAFDELSSASAYRLAIAQEFSVE